MPIRCLRCGGQIWRDYLDEEDYCLQCGCVVYPPDFIPFDDQRPERKDGSRGLRRDPIMVNMRRRDNRR